MRLLSYLVPDGVIEIAGTNRGEVLREMVAVMARSPHLTNPTAFYRAILEREKLVSTGIGFGIAIPHAKISAIDDFCITIGRSRKGVLYPSLDDLPARIIVMIGGPDSKQSTYLKLLARVQKFLKNEKQEILDAPGTAEIRMLLEQY